VEIFRQIMSRPRQSGEGKERELIKYWARVIDTF